LLGATDNGLCQRSSAGNWEARDPSDEHVLDMTALTAMHWLASVRSTVGGLSWRPVPNNCRGSDTPEAIQSLVSDGNSALSGRLLAKGTNVLAVSRDLGRTWQVLGGEYLAFTSPKSALAFDPQLGDVCCGGQDAIKRLALLRWHQTDGEVESHPESMGSPSLAKNTRFAQGQPARVVVSGEGGVVHSLDRCSAWQPMLLDGHNFYFAAVQDPQRPQRWVTALWEKNFGEPQRVHVRFSDDDGKTWRVLEQGDAQVFGGTWSMAARVEGGKPSSTSASTEAS
jgi:hypothetical protein